MFAKADGIAQWKLYLPYHTMPTRYPSQTNMEYILQHQHDFHPEPLHCIHPFESVIGLDGVAVDCVAGQMHFHACEDLVPCQAVVAG